MASAPSRSSSNLKDETDEPPAKRPSHDKFAERDLKKEKYCEKNPGHNNFIPTADFCINHLPALFRDENVFQLVRATSDLTFLLKRSGASSQTNATSGDRSEKNTKCEFTPRRTGENGTGWVSRVEKYTLEDDMDCECDKCHKSGTCAPKKEWAEIYMKTACHVVENDAEAKNANCVFFFDSNELSIMELPTLTGLKVVRKEGDTCEMMCATHDVELVNQLEGMYKRWQALNKKIQRDKKKNKNRLGEGGMRDGEGGMRDGEGGMRDSEGGMRDGEGAMRDGEGGMRDGEGGMRDGEGGMRGGNDEMDGSEGRRDGTKDEEKVCVIVSHPHGRSKHVTVGTWTKRSSLKDHDRYVDNCVYTYRTPTCIGSSGAPVITLPRDGERILCWSNYPAHSGASTDVPGISGGNREAMLLPRDEHH